MYLEVSCNYVTMSSKISGHASFLALQYSHLIFAINYMEFIN
jgi:hypothetical protein